MILVGGLILGKESQLEYKLNVENEERTIIYADSKEDLKETRQHE